MITINSAKIVYATDRLVLCDCSMVARTPLGDASLSSTVTLVEAQALPMPDWTDIDLVAAIALELDVDVSEVSIANA